MRKIIFVLAVALLLVLPMIMAKQGDTKVAWDTKDLVIKDDGVYRGQDKIVTKDKAEIWIDKKAKAVSGQFLGKHEVKDVYHVDSLIKEDTKVKLYLYYEIQPDVIYYKSHTGKYQGYSTWLWEDKTDCGEEEYCGGYAIVEETLEYATGSNTFTSAISGATWANDGIDITLASTDYKQVGTNFQVIKQVLDKSGVSVSYSYNTLGQLKSDINKTIVGQGDFADYWSLIILAVIITIIIGLVLVVFQMKKID